MERYRIVKRTRSGSVKEWLFYIQVSNKHFFGRHKWKDLEKNIGLNTDTVSFGSYEEAEDFLLTEVIRGDGTIEVLDSVYNFRRATYYYF